MPEVFIIVVEDVEKARKILRKFSRNGYGVVRGGHCLALMLFGRLEARFWWERFVEMPTVITLCVIALRDIAKRLR